jgi:carbonic anhydrase
MFTNALLIATAAAAAADYSEIGANWASLDSANSLCDTGVEQSPIDLKDATESEVISLTMTGYIDESYEQSNVERSQTKVQAAVTAGQLDLKFNDSTSSSFTPLQFHFHAPSEHTVDGKQYDLEVHFVHKYKDSDPAEFGAVVGVFFDRTAGGNEDNAFLTAIWDAEAEQAAVPIDAFLASIDDATFWSYPGSLTTPPCSEGIKWNVIKQVQPISDAQLERYTALWAGDENFSGFEKGNYRAIQPLNDRTLYISKPVDALEAGASTLATAAVAISAVLLTAF